ncbi:acetyltransferase [Halobacteroides halobius DSM 5150]|uniref:Acetyltransferase n=1 Tax=Halobacteroides halobius (strain ATCC 35273 / DSM 5150 / MD-1) TaxID=748449 RepID=L0K8V4_HALHC|nr:GNAT family N-acetyltransferase [Halobacteroides halobius]AGB40975.1 acetyltransferase [Halobacteroides halobius DSM 5150]
MEWLVVYDEDEVVSNICLEKVDNRTYILSNFYTAPSERNKGIGRKFLSTVLNDYTRNTFLLFVNEENKGVISLYNKLGFEICDKVLDIENQ